MGRQGSRLWFLGGGLIALFLATSSAASVRQPEMDGKNALRASATIALDSATNGTSAPSDGLGAVPTSAPTAAPVISPNSVCPSNGLPGVESVNGKTCCMAYCIECAGVGCSSRGNASHCCATEIAQHAEHCDISGESPCFITPPEPWVPEHTMTYFLFFFVIPFIVVAVLCNRSLLPGCREKGDPDDPANTAHLHGHNTGAAAAPSKKSASPAAQAKKTSGQANRASGRAVEARGRAEGASGQGEEASGASAL